MSKIGRKAIIIPGNATVKVTGEKVAVNGPLGAITLTLPSCLRIVLGEGKVCLQPVAHALVEQGSLWGFYHRSLTNALTGVVSGFTRTLELLGVGYRAKKEGEAVILSVGFSHTVKITPPAGVNLTVENDTKIKVSGVDKQKVGEVAAKIRDVKPVEPYKSKGIKYTDEVVRKKAGKAGKVGTAFGAK